MAIPPASGARSDIRPVKVFVAADGNGFMRDIASWIVEAAALTGRPSRLVDDELPAVDGSLNLVVAPHEFFELTDAPRADLQRAAAASVCICTEQPGTPWFHLSVDACRRGLHSLDISPVGTQALRDIGIDARHLPLGAVPSLHAAGTAPTSQRPLDVVFLGGLDDRRGAVLAELAPTLEARRCQIRLFGADRPATASTPGTVFGAEKYALLADAKVLVNLHRDRSAHLPPGSSATPYFEWARLVEAMANGCVVVSEPSAGHEPLVPGRHFLEVPTELLGDALDDLLGNPDRLDEIAAAAYEIVTADLALATTIEPLLAVLELDVVPRLADHVRRSDPTRGLWRLGATRTPPPVRLAAFRPFAAVQRAAKRLALAENRMLRGLDAASCLLRHGVEQETIERATPAYLRSADSGAAPRVSVVVTVYDYADVVAETLDSIIATVDAHPELIVVEDHANDASRAVLGGYLDAHPEVPMLLLAKEANAGLAAARNTGFARARGEYVMVMDADNHVTPHCISRLTAALDADPAAAAAYAILEDFGARRGVRSTFAWDPGRLCVANYIDAQAMWRRSAWERLGGYRDDDDLVFGWEDWDLWLRLAADGGHAVLVPEILGRYRVQAGSMISLTNLATDDALADLRRRYPSLPWPADAQ